MGAARRTERLMCLVFLLKARGSRGVTRAELKTAIEDYAACPNAAAYERMLERDKHDLREVGIIVDVHQRDAWHEDEFAYVLGSGSMLSLPPLDPEELRVLALAAEAWERGTWSAAAQGALHKVEVFGTDLVGEVAPRVSLHADATLSPIRDAIRSKRTIAFSYRRPGDVTPASRRVEPWGMLFRHGGWYCVGFDIDRDAYRVFRTSRITSVIDQLGDATHAVDPAWATLPISAEEASATLLVQLLIKPDHGWQWRSRGTVIGTATCGGASYDTVDVLCKDHAGLIGALAASAPSVLVAHPAELRVRVADHLEAIAHG